MTQPVLLHPRLNENLVASPAEDAKLLTFSVAGSRGNVVQVLQQVPLHVHSASVSLRMSLRTCVRMPAVARGAHTAPLDILHTAPLIIL